MRLRDQRHDLETEEVFEAEVTAHTMADR